MTKEQRLSVDYRGALLGDRDRVVTGVAAKFRIMANGHVNLARTTIHCAKRILNPRVAKLINESTIDNDGDDHNDDDDDDNDNDDDDDDDATILFFQLEY
uniref:Uncharacterized protein n=1 Tax=Vespula pensylvanica TaxID=30213 RepID=A0A834P8L7_VESPE|nr:hypothetical protein H0235_005254 [Vespula pensylvanica]